MKNIFLILIVTISFVTLAGCENKVVEKPAETIPYDRDSVSDTGRTSAELEKEDVKENIVIGIKKCEEIVIDKEGTRCVYIVKKGDTQSELSPEFGYSLKGFSFAINRDPKAYLKEGETLKIPVKFKKDEKSKAPAQLRYPERK